MTQVSGGLMTLGGLKFRLRHVNMHTKRVIQRFLSWKRTTNALIDLIKNVLKCDFRFLTIS